MVGLPRDCWTPEQDEVPWTYSDWFEPLAPAGKDWHPVITEAQNHLTETAIGNHPFFAHAAQDSEALAAWVRQELIVTGSFAQYLLLLGSQIKNVHVRARLVLVA